MSRCAVAIECNVTVIPQNIWVRLFRFLAIPQPSGGVRVIALQPRFSRDPIETLTVEEFVSRSAANWVQWRDAGNGMLTVTVDRYGVTLIEMRPLLR